MDLRDELTHENMFSYHHSTGSITINDLNQLVQGKILAWHLSAVWVDLYEKFFKKVYIIPSFISICDKVETSKFYLIFVNIWSRTTRCKHMKLFCPIWWSWVICGYLNSNWLKLNKIRNSVPFAQATFPMFNGHIYLVPTLLVQHI